MKTSFYLSCTLVAVFSLQSFDLLNSQSKSKYRELKKNEVVEFNDGPTDKTQKFQASYRRGAFDLSKYAINVNPGVHLEVSERRECFGKHQSDLKLQLSSGSVSRNGDTLKIQVKTIYDKLYIISIKEKGLIDSLSSNININLVSNTEEGGYCPNMVSTEGSDLNIVALPKGVSTDEIFKAHHKDKTVGVFTYFLIKDSEGKTKTYPQGDYVIMGGNSLSVTE